MCPSTRARPASLPSTWLVGASEAACGLAGSGCTPLCRPHDLRISYLFDRPHDRT